MFRQSSFIQSTLMSAPALIAQDLPLPRHTVQYQNAVSSHPDLAKAFNMFPHAELEYAVGAFPFCTDVKQLKLQLVMLHWFNPICHTCHQKDPNVALGRCSGCHLYWYCSEQCQAADWNRHASECGNVNSSLDPKNPYMPVCVDTQSS